MVITPHMRLVLPDASTPAQDWARIMNENFSKIDYHNHILGSGNQLIAFAPIQNDVNMNAKNMRNVEYVRFDSNAEPDSSACLFVNVNHDLVFQNSLFSLPITSGAGLNVTGIAQGFTLTADPPEAFYDSSVLGIRFYSSTANDTSTFIAQTLICDTFLSTTFSTTDVSLDAELHNETITSRFIVANITLPTVTTSTITTTWKAFETANLYKLSENGVFYYDDIRGGYDNNLYELSYFFGAKAWISSPNLNKEEKVGIRYFIKTYPIPSTNLKIDQLFLIPSLTPSTTIVSFVPIFVTSTAQLIGEANSALNRLPTPFIGLYLSNGAVRGVTINVDWSTAPIAFQSMTLLLKVIYAEPYEVTD